MPSEKHEEILLTLIEEIQKKGLRVIRLDKRIVPDAIAIDFRNKKVIGLEASTNSTSVCITKTKYPANFEDDFDEVLLAYPTKKGKYLSYPSTLKLKAIKMREKGLSIKRIQTELQVKSYASVWNWCHGKQLPK